MEDKLEIINKSKACTLCKKYKFNLLQSGSFLAVFTRGL